MYMNVKGGTHLDLNDRIKIQAELEKGSMLKVIAAIVNADERTKPKRSRKEGSDPITITFFYVF